MKSRKSLLRIVGDNVRQRRLKSELSQEKLAELANVHRNYIGRVERYELNLSLLQLERIADALKISILELLTDDGEK